MKIRADELAQAIVKELSEFENATEETVKAAVDKAAKNAVSALKTDSPKRTGKYAASWADKVDKSKKARVYTRIVYSKDPHYRLTHLLEKGHKARNGRFISARVHISPIEKNAIDDVIQGIKDGLDNDA